MPTEALLQLVARVIAHQAMRQQEAKNSSDPGVITTEAASTPERPPSQGDLTSATQLYSRIDTVTVSRLGRGAGGGGQ